MTKSLVENWPTISIVDFDPIQLDLTEFKSNLFSDSFITNKISIARHSPSGASHINVSDYYSDSLPECDEFIACYTQNRRFYWDASNLIFINTPCYLLIGTGVVITEDGKIIEETLFNPPNRYTINEACGGYISIENLQHFIKNAPHEKKGLWSPFLSRWSNVYGHIMSEGLVQDYIYHKENLSELICYLIPQELFAAQKNALNIIRSDVHFYSSPIVKVPKILLSSGFYRHSRLGCDYRNTINDLRIRYQTTRINNKSNLNDKIYIARKGSYDRIMLNEDVLISKLIEKGFKIYSWNESSMTDQIKAFENAQLIVGPFGSGLINASFAKYNATLIELRALNTKNQSPNWDSFYIDMCATMGINYCVHISHNPVMSDDWIADIQSILTFIDKHQIYFES